MHVPGDKKVEMAVAVKVGPSGAGTESAHLYARAFGHILELASS